MRSSRKRRITKALEKWVLNPGPKLALRLGVAPRSFALLETTGWKTGKLRHTPLGGRLEGSTFWLVSEHGEHSSYVKNLLGEPRVRIKIGRTWSSGSASVVVDDDALSRRVEMDKAHGVIGRIDGLVFRANATKPTTVRIDLD